MPQDEKRVLKKFIGEEIDVVFNTPPLFTKKPECPDELVWRNQKYRIVKILMAWQDISRRGSREKNMSPEHAERASLKGSWGVGRYHFRIETSKGEIFEIYYDRAPEKSADRSGHWFLLSRYINNIQ
jgi:hypothetical protein